MLTGAELGKAIETALVLKGISKAALARKFEIKPPSVAGWIKSGRISKQNFETLRQFLSDVVGPEHWGLTAYAPHIAMEPHASNYRVLSDDEWWLVLAYRQANKQARAGMLSFARAIVPKRPITLKKRTGT